MQSKIVMPPMWGKPKGN